MIGRMSAALAGLLILAVAATAQAEPRVALVVGNSNYGSEMGKLPNPINDANLMAQALKQTGFEVIKVTDVNQKSLKRAIIDFGDKLTSAGATATGLFFYAGHGVQVQGMNYLVPIGAEIGKESDVGLEAVSADEVLKQMEYAGARVNIVILDACRNNPLARGFRSVSRGLAPMDATRGTFIAYSTSPGDVAADGSGTNSPYSAALAKTIVRPGIGIEEAFREVRAEVMAATSEKQVPWDSSSLTAPFYFKGGGAKPAAVTTAPAISGLEAEKAVWEAVEKSKQAGDYQAYLDQYPQGTYATLARSRLASLGNPAAPAAATTAPAAATTAPAPKSAAEKAAWDSIRDSQQVSDFQAYLAQYPQGTYAPLARMRITELNRAAPVTPAPQQQAPAAATAPAPAPVAGDTSSGGLFGGLFGSGTSSGQNIELDSKGVDCRIVDTTRASDECRNTKKPKKPEKPGH